VLDRGYPTINMGATSGAIYIVRTPVGRCDLIRTTLRNRP
jgi:hypothetical protein